MSAAASTPMPAAGDDCGGDEDQMPPAPGARCLHLLSVSGQGKLAHLTLADGKSVTTT
jgi:hypothetical protein